jgi:hypothetical protein
VGIHNGPNAGFLHARPGAAEELEVRPTAAECIDQPGGVEVTGRFASRY